MGEGVRIPCRRRPVFWQQLTFSCNSLNKTLMKPDPKREIAETLRSHKLKATKPRLAILMTLMKEHGPFTAKEIQKRVRSVGCDLVTIYRSVTQLEEAGIIRRCEFGDGNARYEYSRADHHHHHIICKNCRKVEVIEDCHLDEIDKYGKKLGYTNVSHSLEFFGLCPHCQSI